MEIITFYSYKGGVGRSLALSNTASYLSKLGFNVCLLDLDLEAPGLHYKFNVDISKIRFGVVDHIYEFIQAQKSKTLESYTHPQINDYALRLSSFGDSNSGNLFLIPAGNTSDQAYWDRLASINWNEFLYSSNSSESQKNENISLGIPFFLEIIKKIEKEIKPDFLLVDSRTGITEIGGISTVLIPDKVVILFTNNQENIDGLAQVYKRIANAFRIKKDNGLKVFFGLTRIPQDAKEEVRIKERISFYLNKQNIGKKFSSSDFVVLHSDRNLELNEKLIIEELNIKEESFFLNDFLELFNRLFSYELIRSKVDIYVNTIINTTSLLEEPEKIEGELESLAMNYRLPSITEKLILFYNARNVHLIDKTKYKKVIHNYWRQLSGNYDFKLSLFSKYIDLFANETYFSHVGGDEPYNISIVEAYIKNKKGASIEHIKRKIAFAYSRYEKRDSSIKIYRELLADNQNVEIKDLENLFQLFLQDKRYDECKELLNTYNEYFLRENPLKVLTFRYFTMTNHVKEAIDLILGGDWNFLRTLIIEGAINTEPFIKIAGLSANAAFLGKLDSVFKRMLAEEDIRSLVLLGKLYQDIGRFTYFEENVSISPVSERVLEEIKVLSREVRRRPGYLKWS